MRIKFSLSELMFHLGGGNNSLKSIFEQYSVPKVGAEQ